MTNTTIEDGDGWTINGNASSSLYYNCSGLIYFGGDGISGQGSSMTQQFTGLPAHTQVEIEFTYLYGDYWLQNDYAYLYADGNQIWNNCGWKQQENYSTDCGSYYESYNVGWWNVTESIVNYTITIPHTASSISLDFNASISDGPTTAWYAIKEVVLSFVCNNANCSTCDPNAYTHCTTCASNYYSLGTTCYSPCPDSYYISGSTCASKKYIFEIKNNDMMTTRLRQHMLYVFFQRSNKLPFLYLTKIFIQWKLCDYLSDWYIPRLQQPIMFR